MKGLTTNRVLLYITLFIINLQIPSQLTAQTQTQILQAEQINMDVLSVIDLSQAHPQPVIEGPQANLTIQVKDNNTYYIEPKQKAIEIIDPRIYDVLTPNIKQQYLPEDIKILPGKYVQTGANSNQQIFYYVAFENKLPMEYNHQEEVFEGSVKFFLIPENNNQNVTLQTPLELEIVSHTIEEIQPVAHTIDHFSIPMTTINLRDKDVADFADIKIVTKAHPSGFETEIPVQADIQLYSGKVTLQGLGIERIPIKIVPVGTNDPSPRTVILTAEKGNFENNTIEISNPNPGIAYLRTAGLGKEKIIAHTGNASSNVLELKYIFPFRFILMAILGGIIGGIIKVGLNKKLKAKRAIPLGILIGLVVALAWYVVEINLLTFDHKALHSELAVLIISALGALFGLKPKP